MLIKNDVVCIHLYIFLDLVLRYVVIVVVSMRPRLFLICTNGDVLICHDVCSVFIVVECSLFILSSECRLFCKKVERVYGVL